MLETIPLAVAFACIAIASVTDVVKREIPAKLVYFMFAFGVLYNAALGGLASDITIPLFSAASGLMGFAVGLIFWKVGAWAGGDSKFFAGLATILPFGFMRFTLFPFAILLISMAAFVIYTFIHTAYRMVQGVNPSMKRVRINMLQEGMAPGEYVFKDGLAVKRSPYGRGHPCPKFTEIYADPRGMEGLTREQIAKLKETLGEDDTLYIRRTHAFVPFFGIGLVVMLVLII